MSRTIIERLNRLGADSKIYRAEIVREQAKAELQALADANGFSYFNWLATGRWQKYEEIETVSMKRVETLRRNGNDETETVQETAKNANTRSTEGIKVVLDDTERFCEQCKEPFRSVRKTKRFCSESCKNRFNNNLRRA